MVLWGMAARGSDDGGDAALLRRRTRPSRQKTLCRPLLDPPLDSLAFESLRSLSNLQRMHAVMRRFVLDLALP